MDQAHTKRSRRRRGRPRKPAALKMPSTVAFRVDRQLKREIDRIPRRERSERLRTALRRGLEDAA